MQKYNTKSKTEIKVKAFLNEENLPYQKNNNITDKNIYEFWNKYIKGVKVQAPLADKDEYIPRSYWPVFEEISREDLWSINHAIWFVADGFIKDNFKPNSDTLIIKEAVPEKFMEGIISCEGSEVGDITYNAPCLVPESFTKFYPFRYYYLDRSNMTELVTSVYRRKCLGNIIDFITVYDYQKIIIEGPDDSFYRTLFEEVKQCFTAREIIFKPSNLYKKAEPRKANPKATGIHISLDYDDESIGYPVHNKITDDDLYAYWGRKATSGGREKQFLGSEERRKAAAENTREAWIEYSKSQIAKKKWRPIPTEGFEVSIDREYLPPMNTLQGEDLKLLGHPMWQIAREIINEQFVPRSKTMVVAACSNTKPYIDNTNYFHLKKRMEQGVCDVFINSCEFWPLNLSPYLHARIYDWSHLRETPFVQEALIHCNFHSIVEQQARFGFKKIVVVAPCGNPDNPDDLSSRFYPMLMDLLYKCYKGTDIDVEFELDEETVRKSLKLIKNWGLLKYRHWLLKPCRNRFDTLIGYNGPDKVMVDSDEEINQRVIENDYKRYAKKKQRKEKGFCFFSEKVIPETPLN